MPHAVVREELLRARDGPFRNLRNPASITRLWPVSDQSLPLLFALSLAACNSHVRRDPAELPVVVPEAFTAAADPGVRPADRWWTAFEDPALDSMMERMLAQNLDLRAAWERVVQARALAGQAGSARYPQVTASAGAGASRIYVPEVGPMGPTGAVESDVGERYALSVGVAYEVDLWGRIGALTDAAEADVAASELDRQALAVSLTASLADTWFALVEQRAQHALIESQLEVNRTMHDLLKLRFTNGLATAVDVLQQEALLKSVEASQPLVVARVELFRHRPDALLARAPASGTLADQATLPALPAIPGPGVPSELLERRPDIRAAQSRLAAADHRVAAAVAERLPSLRLDASTGLQADSFSDLIDRWVWSVAANLVAPLVDGGRRAAEVERRKAALREGVQRLGSAFLDALREVEDALVQERQQTEHLARLDAQLATSQTLFDESRARYLEGVGDYLPVLSALRSLQQAEQTRLSAHRQQLSYRVQLHRALGGDLPAEAPAAQEASN